MSNMHSTLRPGKEVVQLILEPPGACSCDGVIAYFHYLGSLAAAHRVGLFLIRETSDSVGRLVAAVRGGGAGSEGAKLPPLRCRPSEPLYLVPVVSGRELRRVRGHSAVRDVGGP